MVFFACCGARSHWPLQASDVKILSTTTSPTARLLLKPGLSCIGPCHNPVCVCLDAETQSTFEPMGHPSPGVLCTAALLANTLHARHRFGSHTTLTT